MTIVVSGLLVALALRIRHIYDYIGCLIAKMNSLVRRTEMFGLPVTADPNLTPPSHNGRTAVLLVGGYNGLGMRSLLSLLSYHGRAFRNIIFVQIGVVNSAIFQSPESLEELRNKLTSETGKYTDLVQRYGFGSEAFYSLGSDLVSEMMKLAPRIHEKYPKAVFFGGQIMLPEDGPWDRLLHNYQSFSLQRNLFREGIPFELLPVSLEYSDDDSGECENKA